MGECKQPREVELADLDGSGLSRRPHNSNVSNGIMFDVETLRGEAIDRNYAERRRQYEYLVEVTQIKGDSETHESLSPEYEFARIETYEHYLSIAQED